MAVKFKSHIFKEATETLILEKESATLQDFIDSIPEKYDRGLLHVQHNDKATRDWDVEVKDEDSVLITFVPAGGGDSNKVLSTVISVALMSFAPGFGARTAEGWGMTGRTASIVGGLVSAGFTYVASLVINAVFPPSTNRNTELIGADPAESAILSVQGARNALKPYSPCITLYGEHKVIPPLCAEPYTLHKGDDTYLCMLFDCGAGDVNLYDMRFGEDKYLNAYDDIEIAVHKDLHSGGSLQIYTNDVGQEDYALLCKYNDPQVVTTEINTDKAILDLSFLKGLVRFDDQGKRQTWYVTFDIEYRAVGDTNWEIFDADKINFTAEAVVPNDHSAIYFFPGAYLERNVNLVYKAGTTSMSIACKGYAPKVGDVMFIANRVINIDVAVTNPYGDYYIVEFSEPLKYDLGYAFAARYNYTWNLGGTRIGPSGLTENPYLRLWGGDIKIREGGTDISNVQVVKATMQNFTAGVEMEFATSGQYEIRITRTTGDTNSSRYFDEMTITTLRSIRNTSPLALDHQRTILEMKVRANDQLNGVIDDFNFIGKRVLPVYNGSTWSNEETSNPAWIAYQILTGVESPRPVGPSKLNLASFYAFSQWCDQLNEDGNPKFTNNLLVDYSTTVRELINNLLSSCRASITQTDNEYGIIIDTVKSSVGLITPRNSWGFSGSRTFMTQPHALKTTFIDKNANYEIREIMVYADGYDENNATVIQNFDTFAVTEYKQAWSLARYFIAQGIHRSNTISFDMDIENLIFTRGDVFDFQNDIIRKGGTSARILAHTVVASKSQIQLDTDIEGSPTGIVIRTAYGTLVSASVTQISTDTLECDVEITGIEKYDVVSYGELDSETSKYLVKAITYKADMVATIEAVDYAPQIFDADTGVIPPYDSGAVFNNSNTPPDYVREVRVTQDIQYKDRFPYISVAINWKPAQNSFPKAFEIYTYKDNKWKLVDVVYNPPYLYVDSIRQEDLDIVGKILRFKVLAVSANGRKKDLSQAEEITFKVVKDNIGPSYVTNHKWSTEGNRLKLSWTNPSDVDFDGVEIRRDGNGRGIESSEIVYRSNYLESSCLLDPVEGTYHFRAVDTSGNYSFVTADLDVAFVAPKIVGARIEVSNSVIQFNVEAVDGSFSIDRVKCYQSLNSEPFYESKETVFSINQKFNGAVKFYIKAFDYLGNASNTYESETLNIIGGLNYIEMPTFINKTITNFTDNLDDTYTGPTDTTKTWSELATEGFTSWDDVIDANGDKWFYSTSKGTIQFDVDGGFIVDGALGFTFSCTDGEVNTAVKMLMTVFHDFVGMGTPINPEIILKTATSGVVFIPFKNAYQLRLVIDITSKINTDDSTFSITNLKLYGYDYTEEGGASVLASDASGTTVYYNAYYYQLFAPSYSKNVRINILNPASGDYVEVTVDALDHFTVKVFDSTGTRKDANITFSKRGVQTFRPLY